MPVQSVPLSAIPSALWMAGGHAEEHCDGSSTSDSRTVSSAGSSVLSSGGSEYSGDGSAHATAMDADVLARFAKGL